jgi:hypothetical protein
MSAPGATLGLSFLPLGIFATMRGSWGEVILILIMIARVSPSLHEGRKWLIESRWRENPVPLRGLPLLSSPKRK